jgi:hypothetical protein
MSSECENISTYAPLIVTGSLFIISEVLTFVPEKYVKARGILQFLVLLGRRFMTPKGSENQILLPS